MTARNAVRLLTGWLLIKAADLIDRIPSRKWAD